VAKSTKHKDSVKPLPDFRAPWENEAGEAGEIDPDKLKRYIHGLLVDKASAQDAREDALADVATANTERDEFKTQAEANNPAEAQKQIDALQAKLDKAQGALDKIEADKEAADLRAEVLGDFEAKNPKAAKYVVGTTKEELEKSLEEVRADFGIEAGEGDEDPDDDNASVRTAPRKTSLTNGGDPKGAARGTEQVDFDKVAGEIIGGGRVFG
jgi:hypothetical protein